MHSLTASPSVNGFLYWPKLQEALGEHSLALKKAMCSYFLCLQLIRLSVFSPCITHWSFPLSLALYHSVYQLEYTELIGLELSCAIALLECKCQWISWSAKPVPQTCLGLDSDCGPPVSDLFPDTKIWNDNKNWQAILWSWF